MLNAALMGDASKGSKTLDGAAKVGIGYGMGKAESGNSVYHQAAAAAGHKIMGPSPPPAMPSGAAYQALCDAALAESKTAREEYEAAAKDHAGDTAALVQAKLGLSLAAEPAARARAPPEKGAVEDAEAAHEESGARLAAAAVKLYETHKKATEAAGDAAVPVVKDAFQDLFPSPSPPPPPFTAGGFGLDMLNAALMGDASKGSKTLDGAAKVGIGYGMGKAESGNSVYHQAAAAAGHKIMGPSPPPAMPSGAAMKARFEAAAAEAKAAREEYEAAAKEHAATTAALVQAKAGLALAAEPAAASRRSLRPAGLAALAAAALAVALSRRRRPNKGRAAEEEVSKVALV